MPYAAIKEPWISNHTHAPKLASVVVEQIVKQSVLDRNMLRTAVQDLSLVSMCCGR